MSQKLFNKYFVANSKNKITWNVYYKTEQSTNVRKS